MHRHGRAGGFRQRVAQRHHARGERGVAGQVRTRLFQRGDDLADRRGDLADHRDALARGRARSGQRTLEVTLERRGDFGERGHLGHGEGAVHGVHGAQQRVGDRLAAAAGGGEPRVDGFQVAGDFRLEDLEQHRVDGEAGFRGGLGHFDGGRNDFRQHRLGLGRRGHGLGLHRGRRGRRDRLGGRGRRRRVEHFLARGNALGQRLDARQVGVHRFALQRGAQQRQRVEGVFDQRHHGRAGRARAVEHAVEHGLDLPAELAQGLGANQAATALERVEDAADRPQLLHVVGLAAPVRQELLEVADFLLEFLQEDFADLVVDFVAGAVETGDGGRAGDDRRGRDGFRRRDRRGGLDDRRRFRHRLGDGFRLERGHRRGDFGRQLDLRRLAEVEAEVGEIGLGGGFHHRLGFGDGFHHGLGRGRRRHFGHRRGRDRLGGGRGGHRGGRRRQVFGRQRPVAERLEVLAGDIEDLFALRATVAQRLEVVLEASERVGQAVHLLAVGHAAAAQQFVLGELAHGGQVLRRVLHLEDAQRTGHFLEQARHVGQLGVVPVGFHEGDETLAGLGEVGDGLLHQHFQHHARFAAGQRALGRGGGLGLGAGLRFAEAGDLVVQRGFDVEQCAGDVEQARLVSLALAAGDGVDGGALVLHHAARHAQAEHAERVGDAVEGFGLFAQLGGRGLRAAQVQVERVLHAQQVFLDGRGHGGQQRLVAAAEAAARVGQLGLAGQVLAQAEDFADLADAAVVGGRMGDEIKQLAGEFQRRVGAEGGVAALGQALDLLLHLGQRLLERLAGLEGVAGERVERAGGHPEQAARMLGVGDGHQLLAHVGEVADGGGAVVVLQPAQQRRLEQAAQGLGAALELFRRQRRGRAGGGRRQRARQVGREQHGFGQALLAARLAQLVEQGQQHDGDVAVAALQALEVVGQLHDAAHQRRVAGIALGDLALDQGLGQLLHFLGDHGGAVELDHAQGALHLVQQVGAGLELARVLAFLDVGFQRQAGLAQGLVELGLDPGERGEIDVFVQPHAEVLSGCGRREGRPHRCVARGKPGPGISPAA